MNAIAIPTRARPFAKTQAKTPTWLKLILNREIAPTEREYDAVTKGLWDGDPAMDSLVEWMFEFGARDARALFERALNHGYQSIEDCPEPLVTFFKQFDSIPDWVEFDAINDGIHFIHGVGLAGPYVLRDLALMGGYMLSGFNQALVMTGALNKGTQQRIAETGKWWMDCTEFGGLERFGNGFKNTIHVRLVHALVRRNLSRKEEWDHSVWGTPLSQIDMVATYLGFSVVMLGGLRKMGIPVTPKESKGVMQLWSYACWIMGVDYRWLTFTESEGLVLLNHTMMTQSPPDWTSRELAVSLSKEPLERSFPNLQSIRRKIAYHQHLSVSQFFLGDDKMKKLGLPDDVTSWYPLLSLGPRFGSYTAQRFMPSMRSKLEKRGRKAQKEALASMFGDQAHDVIRPDENHPAHI